MADRPTPHARHALELVPGCSECDALAPDLAAISSSLASLRRGTQAGHRDFRLTPDDAARLRRGRGLRAWLRPLAGAGFAFARPLGSALTVVALVGLVASSLPGGLVFLDGNPAAGVATDHGREQARNSPPAAPVPSAAAAFEGASASPKAEPSGDAFLSPLTVTTAPSSAPTAFGTGGGGFATPSGIFLASLVLLPIGLLLVFGRGLARRLVGAAREP